MLIHQPKFYVGFNRITPFNTISLRVSYENKDDFDNRFLPDDVIENMAAQLPELAINTAPPGKILSVGNILADLIRNLLALGGEPSDYQSVTLNDGRYEEVAVGYWSRELAKLATIAAINMACKLAKPTQPGYEGNLSRRNPESILKAFLEGSRVCRLDLSTLALVKQAQHKGISWKKVRFGYRLVQLGQAKQLKHIHETRTSHTSELAAVMSSDKEYTAHMLSRVGIPVPSGYVISSKKDLGKTIRKLTYPLVVKPNKGGKGKFVYVNIEDEASLKTAFQKAIKHSSGVRIEQYIEGDDHRLLVVSGKLVAACHRIPAHVIGDGMHSIRELVGIVNSDPERGVDYEKLLVKIKLDKQAQEKLATAGISIDSVPPEGMAIYLRDTANISTGGTARDVTDSIHPDNRTIVELAATVLGLDIAGVDFISRDIKRSWREIGGAICEVNVSPGLRPHWIANPQHNVCKPIIDHLYTSKEQSRIPIAAITGTVGKTTVSHMLASLLGQTGDKVGLCSSSGVYVDMQQLKTGDFAGGVSSYSVLSNPQVDIAVLEMARGALIKAGMGIGGCDVGALLNVLDDHIGNDGIESREDMAQVKRIVVDGARKAIVINADDSLCVEIAQSIQDKDICYVSMEPDNPIVASHLDNNGKAVYWESENDALILAHGRNKTVLIKTSLIPATMDNVLEQNVQNALFASAMAWMMSVDQEVIRAGLLALQNDFETNPGRFNYFDDLPYNLILDFGHNPDGIKAVCDAALRLPCDGERVLVLTSPGNRIKSHFSEIARVSARGFDRYILHDWKDLRGQKPGYVPNLLREELIKYGVNDKQIEIIAKEDKAVERGLTSVKAGDQLILFVQDIIDAKSRIDRAREGM